MSWFSRNLGRSRRPEPRTVESGQILRDDHEIVIQHGYHKYCLRATRSGRLKMSGNRLAVEVRWLALAFGLFLGYLASAPFVLMFASEFATPSMGPAIEVVFWPVSALHQVFPPYQWYCDWLFNLIVDLL